MGFGLKGDFFCEQSKNSTFNNAKGAFNKFRRINRHICTKKKFVESEKKIILEFRNKNGVYI